MVPPEEPQRLAAPSLAVHETGRFRGKTMVNLLSDRETAPAFYRTFTENFHLICHISNYGDLLQAGLIT